MTTTVTFTITGNSQQKTGEFKVEDKKYINCILGNVKNDTITVDQYKKLQSIANRAGDMGILEKCDFQTAIELKALADANGYDDMYDISVSKDGKYLLVKVKETTINPRLGIIKKDFNIPNKYFIEEADQYNPTYGKDNADLISKRHTRGKDDIVSYDYDSIELEPGDELKLSIDKISINNSVNGGWGRLFQGIWHTFTTTPTHL